MSAQMIDTAAMAAAVAVELVRPVVGTPREAAVAEELRKQLLVTWQCNPVQANAFIDILFAMVRNGQAD